MCTRGRLSWRAWQGLTRRRSWTSSHLRGTNPHLELQKRLLELQGGRERKHGLDSWAKLLLNQKTLGEEQPSPTSSKPTLRWNQTFLATEKPCLLETKEAKRHFSGEVRSVVHRWSRSRRRAWMSFQDMSTRCLRHEQLYKLGKHLLCLFFAGSPLQRWAIFGGSSVSSFSVQQQQQPAAGSSVTTISRESIWSCLPSFFSSLTLLFLPGTYKKDALVISWLSILETTFFWLLTRSKSDISN